MVLVVTAFAYRKRFDHAKPQQVQLVSRGGGFELGTGRKESGHYHTQEFHENWPSVSNLDVAKRPKHASCIASILFLKKHDGSPKPFLVLND